MTGPATGKPCGICRGGNARLYPQGWRCPVHAPKPPPRPDPARTVIGLQERRWRAIRALAEANR